MTRRARVLFKSFVIFSFFWGSWTSFPAICMVSAARPFIGLVFAAFCHYVRYLQHVLSIILVFGPAPTISPAFGHLGRLSFLCCISSNW